LRAVIDVVAAASTLHTRKYEYPLSRYGWSPFRVIVVHAVIPANR
jgi:hypothetical protein